MPPPPPLEWYRIAAVPTVVAFVALLNYWKPNPRFAASLIGGGLFAIYGSIQDQFSVRLCQEYFTILHNPIPGLTNPTLLGIAWGGLAATGGGMMMGFILGAFATYGPHPQLTARELVRPLVAAILVLAIATALTGISAYHAAGVLGVQPSETLQEVIPPENHRGLFTVTCYHVTSYVSSVVATIGACVWVGRERARRHNESRVA